MQLTFIRLCSAQQQPEPGLSEFGVLVEDIKWAASHSRNVIFNLIIYACNHATLVLAKEILKWESSGIWVEEFESSSVSWIYESYTIYKSSFGRSMENFWVTFDISQNVSNNVWFTRIMFHLRDHTMSFDRRGHDYENSETWSQPKKMRKFWSTFALKCS